MLFSAQDLAGVERGSPVWKALDSAERLVVHAENQIPSQIDSNRLASDFQTAAGRQPQASVARDEDGCRHV
jgi:hypothetical protein